MFEKIKEEIKQDYYIQNFPNDGQRFVAWYLRNVHLRDQNEAKADITDGADDKQIDAIYVDDDNSTIYVVQGKFVGADTIDAEPLREVLSAWLQLKDLARLQETANNKLKMKLAEVALALDDDYDVMFELLTTGSLTPMPRPTSPLSRRSSPRPTTCPPPSIWWTGTNCGGGTTWPSTERTLRSATRSSCNPASTSRWNWPGRRCCWP